MENISLDVAAGAIGAAAFVASLADAGRVHWSIYATLGFAVLVVYNLDHFLDSRRIHPHANERRRGYHAHRKRLAATGTIAAMGLAGSLPFLPASAWIPGILVGAYQVVYFLGLKLGMRGMAKRIAASAGWSAGICLPATTAGVVDRGELLSAGIVLAMLAWINLQSYAIVESASEEAPEEVPTGSVRRLAIGCAIGSICLGAVLHPDHAVLWLALTGVAAVQVLLARIPPRFVHPMGEWSLAALGLFRLFG